MTFILNALENGKARDVVTIDLAGKSDIADAMIIASGTSSRHVSAVADRILRELKDSGQPALCTEGLSEGQWVLIDTGDIIVHIFLDEVRQMYNLEKMWATSLPASSDNSYV